MPWLPLGRGSQFFSAFREPRPSRQRLFCGDGPLAPHPSPSEVRPFELRCQQHRGSLHLQPVALLVAATFPRPFLRPATAPTGLGVHRADR